MKALFVIAAIILLAHAQTNPDNWEPFDVDNDDCHDDASADFTAAEITDTIKMGAFFFGYTITFAISDPDFCHHESLYNFQIEVDSDSADTSDNDFYFGYYEIEYNDDSECVASDKDTAEQGVFETEYMTETQSGDSSYPCGYSVYLGYGGAVTTGSLNYLYDSSVIQAVSAVSAVVLMGMLNL